MGICISSGATPAIRTKLILPDGGLREFERPVTVSHVLQQAPGCFVCDADEMDFEGFVSALRAGEELRQGQLYFVLPKSALEHPLHADDLAALAVKASRALKMAVPRKMRLGRRAVTPLVFAAEPDVRKAVSGDGGLWPRATAPEMKKRRTKTGFKNGTMRKFTTNLSVISE